MAHACNLNTLETKAGGSRIKGQLGLHSKTNGITLSSVILTIL
jgi:hypothetical protein